MVTTGRVDADAPRPHPTLQATGIPARYAHATFVSFAQSESGQLKDMIRAPSVRWAWLPVRGQLRQRRAVRGLTLYGDVGRGKTHLLVALVREMIFRHGVAVHVEFSRLLSLKEGYSEGRSDAPVLTGLAEVEVLAIDERARADCRTGAHDHRRGCKSAVQRHGLYAGDHELRPGNPTGAAPQPLDHSVSGQTLGDRVGDRVYSRLLQLVDFVRSLGATTADLPYR